jgi:hypothetical protein
MNRSFLSFALAVALVSPVAAQGVKPIYENKFDQVAAGKAPDDFLILEGNFVVAEEDGNKFLELPGAPLDTCGALFGPTEKEGLSVTARVFGTGKGRRFPTFAVSLNGAGGYKLQVSPGKKLLELYKGDTVKTSTPFEWESGKWTHLRLQLRKVKEGEWKVEGRAWTAGATEPAAWAITHEEKEEPVNGKAAVWGSPYSTTPIRFDDLAVTPLK